MTVTTHAAVSFSFSFVFTRDLLTLLQHTLHHFMAHSFYAYLASPIVVGVLLTCQSLDPEYKTAAFFRCISKKKKKKRLIFGSIRHFIIALFSKWSFSLKKKKKYIFLKM